MHVVLQNDPSAPVVITSVVSRGATKTKTQKLVLLTFEHLLFEGTENIKRGEWFKIVTGKREQTMPTLLMYRTYYFEVFPSNNLELGYGWNQNDYEVINQIGVDTQNKL
jgi:hypothetical protein